MESIFGSEGLLSQEDPGFTFRAGQMHMAEAVKEAIRQEHHLAVEGGTGVGKSLAYLIPLLQEAWDNNKKVMVSTWSISLQQQLVEKDLPRIQQSFKRPIHWALAKGRQNYLSKRRYQIWRQNAPTLFDEGLTNRLDHWVENSEEGSLSEWAGPMDEKVWESVVSDRDNCLGKRCPHYQDCFFYRARMKMYQADLIVVNHALFFSHLAMGAEGFLPPVDVVVFDEAHHLENTAREHLGSCLTQRDFSKLCDRLLGLMRQTPHDVTALVQEIRLLSSRMFQSLRQLSENRRGQRLVEPPPLPNLLQGPLSSLCKTVLLAAEDAHEDLSLELRSQAAKARQLQVALDRFLSVAEPNLVHWIEGHKNIELVAAPIDVGEILKNQLFSKPQPVCVLTSATLSQAGSFDYFKEQLGFEGQTLVVESPFDYSKQMDLVLDDRLQGPREKGYEDQLFGILKEHVSSALEGGIFILFTSHALLKRMATLLKTWEGMDRLILVQGQDGPDRQVLEKFQEQGNACLLGTDRYWTGVDVPGQALQTVMITKLPFMVPDRPLTQARCERLEAQGRDSFRQLILPETILKLRQGLGRLIRSSTDQGRVVILDGRIVSKNYGSRIRQALPHIGRLWQSD